MHSKHAAIWTFIDSHPAHLSDGKPRYSQSFPRGLCQRSYSALLAHGANAFVPVASMRETLWEIAGNKDGMDVNQVRVGVAIFRARDQIPQRSAVWCSPRIRRTQL